MTHLKTSEPLLRALRLATRPLSAEEKREQRVSFIMGSLNEESTITRAQVESMLEKQENGNRRVVSS